MAVQPISNTVKGQQGQQATAGTDPFNEMRPEDFIMLMVAELQNQDPLNPMDNAQILQQISQIREIASSDALTTTLEAVFLGQNVTTASGMIGEWVMKLSEDDAVAVIGKVDRVEIKDGVPTLNVDGRPLVLKDNPDLQVLSEELGQEVADAMDLIGHTVRGETPGVAGALDREVTGRVTRVLMKDGSLHLRIKNDESGAEYTILKEGMEDVTLADAAKVQELNDVIQRANAMKFVEDERMAI